MAAKTKKTAAKKRAKPTLRALVAVPAARAGTDADVPAGASFESPGGTAEKALLNLGFAATA